MGNFFFLFIYTLSSGIHVKIIQVCYIDIHMPWLWFAASITPSSTLGIYPNVIPPQPSYTLLFLPSPTLQAPVCGPVSMYSLCSTPTYEWEHAVFGFLFLCQFAENDGFQFHPCTCKGHELILFYGCIVFHSLGVPHFLYPVCHWWAFSLIPYFCYCEQCCHGHMRAHVSITEGFIFLWVHT